jgi:predicted transcriptional regulator
MKRNIWIILTGIVVISTLVNIKNQFNTLKSAESKNEELKLKLEQMNVLKNNLAKKAEYATSSAFIDTERKELLGLGTANDYWLNISENSDKVETIIREVHESEKESNIEEWLKLFTD